nr:immunoglobulin light chain junction region [Macaca mulatta]
CQQYSSDEFTF